MGRAVVAAVLIGLGAAVAVWAVIVLGWRRAADLDDTPPDPALPRLVFAGPFGHVRHPQSLGLLLVLAGAAIAFRRPGLWAVAVLGAGVVIAMAVRQDRAMMREFGEPYERYQRAVPLLLPRLRRASR